MKWTISPSENGVFVVDLPHRDKKGIWVMLSADWHWDNPKTNLDRIERDLKEAKKIGAMVLSLGDHFCAMQGKFDKRSSKDALRPEHQVGSYLDRLVDTAAEFLRPYKDVMGLISTGNHETAIYNRHETCLTSRLVERLRAEGSPCRKGSYNGWIMFRFRTQDNRTHGETYRLYYHHGSGGDAPVTQGTIAMSRVSQFVDADCIVSGHLHIKNMSVTCREKLSPKGNRRVYETHLVRCSTYKDEYQPLDGWHIEKGKGPRPTMSPAYWMHLWQDRLGDFHVSFHDSPVGA
jgi:hypothetical protein